MANCAPGCTNHSTDYLMVNSLLNRTLSPSHIVLLNTVFSTYFDDRLLTHDPSEKLNSSIPKTNQSESL